MIITMETPEMKPEVASKVSKAPEAKEFVFSPKEKTKKPAADDDEEVKGGEDETHDPYYPPIVSLPLVDVVTGEDGEIEVFKRRAKLYR